MKLLRAFLLLGVVNCVDAWLPNVVPRYSSSARRHHVILVASREPDEVEFNDASWRPGRPPGRRPIRARRSITSQQDDASTDGLSDEETSTTPVLTPHEQALQDPTLLSSVNVTSMIRSPLLLRSLREMGIQQLTQVQQQTIVPISEGKSVCARSKTGSGKTLAFLLPVLDQLLASKLSPKDNKSAVLIVVPTRELAKQIVDQIQALLVHQPEGDALAVTCLHGGTTSLAVDRRRLVQRWPNILVATPGRLLDHIESKSRLQGGGTFSDMIKTTKVVVLDEADRLLLEGFQKETKRILAALPRGEKRQTLMFSATVPEKMKEMIQGMLPAGSLLQVDCAEGQDRIEKRFLRLPSMDRYSSTLIAVVQQEITEDPERHKLLVFFPTARLVRFFASMFNDALGMDVVEIHSRMSQGGRTKAWTAFASAKSAVMFTSDVSARGLDYPDVTLVVQVGTPFNLNLNTHRIGRTARGGRVGEALLITLPFESKSISGMARRYGYTKESMKYTLDLGDDGLSRVRECMLKHKVLRSHAESAYLSFVAYYTEYGSRDISAADILHAAEAFAAEIGLTELPAMSERLAISLDKR